MKLCDRNICAGYKDNCTEQDRVGCILAEVRYNFMDGMDFPNMKRDFSNKEHDIIAGVFDELQEKVGKWYD